MRLVYIVCSVTVGMCHAFAADLTRLQPEYPVLEIGERDSSGYLWDPFAEAFSSRVGQTFYDRFRQLKLIQQSVVYRDEELVRERLQDRAFDTFNKTLEYSAREMVEHHPVFIRTKEWVEYRLSWSGKFMSDVIVNSLFGIDEEEIEPLDPVSRTAEERWFGRFNRDRDFDKGLKPFRANPYAFIGFPVKHNGNYLFYTHMRYKYERFSTHDFEGVVTVPLWYRMMLSTGFSYELEDASSLRSVVRIHKRFGKGSEAFLSLASSRQGNGAVVFAAYQHAW